MDQLLSEEIIQCFDSKRTMFTYSKDQYAIYLLERLQRKDALLKVRDLKQTRWFKLFDRPVIKPLLNQCGNGYLKADALKSLYSGSPEPFILTLGCWAQKSDFRWAQTSRPGSNLVLQMNISNQWERQFTNLIGKSANHFFGYSHPLSKKRGMTLAWARLDLDFNTDEVLIEEIQSDLIRDMKQMESSAKNALNRSQKDFTYYGEKIPAIPFIAFAQDFLSTFSGIWHEAMLTATLKFCFDELGLSEVYYHQIATGITMKNLRYSQPPRSLYSDLPKRFCFDEKGEPPNFLQTEKRIRRNLKRLRNCNWFQLTA